MLVYLRAVILLFVATFAVSGCSAPAVQSPTKKPAVKVRVGLGGEIGVAAQVADLQGEDICHMTAYRFDSTLTKVGTDEPHEMTDIADLLQKVHDASIPRRNGTFFTPVFEQVLTDAKTNTNPVFVLVLTDGGIDDPVALQRSSVIRHLAECSMLKRVIIGPIHEETRSHLNRQMKALGSKVEIFNPEEFQGMLDHLQAAQTAAGSERSVILFFDDSKSIDRS